MNEPDARGQPDPEAGPLAARTARRTGRWISASLLLGIGAVFALTQLPFPHHSLLGDAILDAGHAPLFAVFTYFAWRQLERGRRLSRTIAVFVALALAAVLGALTEVAQSFTGRNADLGDLARDVAGAAAVGVVVIALPVVRSHPRRRAAVVGVSALVVLAALVSFPLRPLVRVMRAFDHRDAIFPVLFDLEREDVHVFVQLRDAEFALVPRPGSGGREAGGRAARITFQPANYPAFILQEPAADWTGFAWLEFDAFLPEDRAIDLFVRLDDATHNDEFTDRFNRRIDLAPGLNAVRIPLEDVRRAPRDREFDLRRVRTLALFVHPSLERRALIFDRIRLTGPTSGGSERSP